MCVDGDGLVPKSVLVASATDRAGSSETFQPGFGLRIALVSLQEWTGSVLKCEPAVWINTGVHQACVGTEVPGMSSASARWRQLLMLPVHCRVFGIP